MKIYKYFLLCGLAIVAASCAEDIEPSIPQHNPQEPVFKADNVEVVKAGALASDAVLDLESYKASNEIPVMQLVKADSLPDGASISMKVEISDTENFERSQIFNTTAGTPSENGEVTYYASAEDWNNAQVFLMGKSPKVKTMYYRIPVYIDLDGSDYRLNSVDYYAAEGTIQETCFDMGFVIEDNYYLLSDATTWELPNSAEVEKYKFYHRADVSPYDDPNFTYTFTVSQDIIDSKGGCYWKIAPQSVVGTDNWDNVLGTETNGDTSASGMLVSTEAKSGEVTEAGRYQISINMESMKYEVKHLENVLYIVGAPNGWDINNEALYLSETENGSNIYSGTLKIAANQFQFRLYSQLGNWDTGSIGAANEDTGVEISFTDGVFDGNIYQGGIDCPDGKGSWLVTGWEGGAVEITVNLNASTIEMKEVSVESGIYLRGGMNSWGADDAYQFILSDKVSVWEVDKVTIDAGTEFKVADANWDAVNLGAGADPTVMPNVACPLQQGSNDNLKMGVDFTGNAMLTLSGGIYTLTLTPGN